MLRDQQRQEIKQALAGADSPTNANAAGDDALLSEDIHSQFQLQTSLLLNSEMVRIRHRIT